MAGKGLQLLANCTSCRLPCRTCAGKGACVLLIPGLARARLSFQNVRPGLCALLCHLCQGGCAVMQHETDKSSQLLLDAQARLHKFLDTTMSALDVEGQLTARHCVCFARRGQGQVQWSCTRTSSKTSCSTADPAAARARYRPKASRQASHQGRHVCSHCSRCSRCFHSARKHVPVIGWICWIG